MNDVIFNATNILNSVIIINLGVCQIIIFLISNADQNYCLHKIPLELANQFYFTNKFILTAFC